MPLKLAMNTGTFNYQSLDFLRAVKAISSGKFEGINIRDNHIQEHIQKGHTLQDIKDLLAEYSLQPMAVDSLRDWQNWETWEPGEREEYRILTEKFFDECRQIGCDCVAAPTFAEHFDAESDIRSFRTMCDIARPYDMRVALEFLPWAGLNDIRKAWEVVRGADCSNGGLLVDTFHFFKGESQLKDFQEVPPEKVFFIHMNDARDLPLDSKEMCFNHRAFPGEGVFPLKDFLDVLILDIGYRGWFSLEALNQENPKMSYSEVVERGKNTIEKVLLHYNL